MTTDEFGRMIAIGHGAAKLPEYLAGGGNVNAVEPRSGLPLLHLACDHQNLDAIRALVRAGANLQARDSFGATALHWAVAMDIDAVVQEGGPEMLFETASLLVELGASLETKDDRGRTPRDYAADYGQIVLDQFDRRISATV